MINKSKSQSVKATHVKQIGSNSCGVACICMITNQSRNDVIASLDRENSPKSLWTIGSELRRGLESFNYSMSEQILCSDWDKLKEYRGVAILAVNFSAETGNFHWIVWNGADLDKPILDPLSNEKRALHKRTRLMSYYTIDRL